MTTDSNNLEMIIDFVTGQLLPNAGSEANRQRVEQFLVNDKGFASGDIHVNFPITVAIGDEVYRSRVDLVIEIDNRMVMAVKCAAGSLGSRQREILAAARLLTEYQLPFSIVSDGETAIVLDTLTGKETGSGLSAVPNRNAAERLAAETQFVPLPEERREREAIIFRSYDMMNVNVIRDDGERP